MSLKYCKCTLNLLADCLRIFYCKCSCLDMMHSKTYRSASRHSRSKFVWHLFYLLSYARNGHGEENFSSGISFQHDYFIVSV
jgi:hypothetical protein